MRRLSFLSDRQRADLTRLFLASMRLGTASSHFQQQCPVTGWARPHCAEARRSVAGATGVGEAVERLGFLMPSGCDASGAAIWASPQLSELVQPTAVRSSKPPRRPITPLLAETPNHAAETGGLAAAAGTAKAGSKKRGR